MRNVTNRALGFESKVLLFCWDRVKCADYGTDHTENQSMYQNGNIIAKKSYYVSISEYL